ncbi:hypothetical protein ACOME3_003392 [Neoechinorhynchus agilis]
MFSLADISVTIRINPKYFGLSAKQAIDLELQKMFTGKVIQGCGFCIGMYNVKDYHVGQNELDLFIPSGQDGSYVSDVRCQLLMFQPQEQELIMTKVLRSTKEGIFSKFEFFDEIFIPKINILQPCSFDEPRSRWMYHYEDVDSKTVHRLPINDGSDLLVRVIGEEFNDIDPSSPEFDSQPRYRVIASVNELGLAVPAWWM